MKSKENQLSALVRKIYTILPNKYLLILIGYLVYMIFFDSNDFRSQFKLLTEVHSLRKEKVSIAQQLEQVKQEKEMLFSNEKSMEKFAREQYLMQKEGETVFVLVEE